MVAMGIAGLSKDLAAGGRQGCPVQSLLSWCTGASKYLAPGPGVAGGDLP